MFNLRRVLCTVEVFNLVLFLLSSILVVIACKPCSVRDVPNQFEVGACGSYKGSLVDPHDEFGGHVYEHSREDVCQYSSSFCFPSTVLAFSDGETEAELITLGTSMDQRDGFSSGVEQTGSRLKSLPDQRIFRFVFDRNISCALFQQDGYLEFLSSYGDSKNRMLSDISCCFSNLVGNKSPVLESEYEVGTVMLDDSFTPLVEIKPSSLDWGLKTMYEVSKLLLTIRNADLDSILTVYDIYSSNSQFYSCNFTASALPPGEVMSVGIAFSPTELGLSKGQLVFQTSFGGFLILANGISVESPFLVKPLGGFDVSSNGGWRKDLSLFNPFNEAFYVEEVTVWMSTSFGNDSHASVSVWNITISEVSATNVALGVPIGEFGQRKIALKSRTNWEIAPQCRETIMELDISDHFEGNFIALFGLNMRKSSVDEEFSIIIPIEAEFNHANGLSRVLVSLEALVPRSTSGLVFIALSLLNNAPYVLSLVRVVEENDGTKTFKIKSMEGLVLFPGTSTQVAVLSYSSVRTRRESGGNCRLLVLTNDTRDPRIEIPCTDVIRVLSGSQSDSSVGLTKEMRSDVNYIDERQKYVIMSSPQQQDTEIKGVDAIEADEMVLKNWKSQATESGSRNTILEEEELLFPMVLLGNYSSRMITVRNRSPKPVVMQLILNSAEIVGHCRALEPPLHQFSSSFRLSNTSVTPTRYGFSIAKDALTEAYVHPNGIANLGPVLFQPYKRCEWRSSALIRNNASGVEWLSLRGFGGSLSLVLLEDYEPVQVLDFNLNMSASINLTSPDAIYSTVGENHPCPQHLTKKVSVKNTGDLPLEVVRINVSGSECGLDGFEVRNCKGFSLPPGESKVLAITFHIDYSASTIQRDLKLVLASGAVVIPMKVSIPIYLLNFCKRSLFWTRIKKSILGILLAAFLLYLLFVILFPQLAPGFTFPGFKGMRNFSSSLSMMSGLSPLHLKNGLLKSVIQRRGKGIAP